MVCRLDSLPKLPKGMLALLLNKSLSVKSKLARHSNARGVMPPAKLVPLDNARVVCTLVLRHSLKMPTLAKIKNVKDSSRCSMSTTQDPDRT